MARVVCLGAALQDIYLIDKKDFTSVEIGKKSVFNHIEIGNKIDVDRMSHQVGGGGANTAVSFARHGHEAVLLTNIARDNSGDAVLEMLDRENIDSSYVQFNSEHKTGCSIVLLDEAKGERTILTHRGAAGHFNNLTADDLELIQPDWLYITTLHGDFDVLEAFIKQAHKIGCKIMFNPGNQELEQKKRIVELLPKVDILLVNKEEASQIVHGALLDELLERLQRYTKTVIVTSGVMGGIAGNGEETIRFGLYSNVKIADSTGAGDAFGAGFLAHLAAGHDFKDSLIFASANSTSVISQLGAQAGILTGRESLHPMPLQVL